MPSESFGTRRERQIRETAAKLGVADFVYSAPQVRRGAGNREPSGDGLLITGKRGAILQIKTRDRSLAVEDSTERACAWIKKNGKKAQDQGRGSKRELRRMQRSNTPLQVVPVRAQNLLPELREKYSSFVTAEPEDWPTIVILDHPLASGVDLGFSTDTIWFTVEDWQALHQRLRSTAGLLDYVARCLRDQVHVPLGHEVERYSAMREADVEVARKHNSSPVLPDMEDFDSLGATLFHEVIDRVWPDDGPIPWKSADEYRAIVEFLDGVPPALQGQIGRWFLRKRREIADGAPLASGAIRLGFRDRLVFACTHFHKWKDSHWQAEFTSLTALRHTQALESGALDDTVTLGVGALVGSPLSQTGVAHLFVLLKGRQGELPMPSDIRTYYEQKYGIHDHDSGARRAASHQGRNEPCACMSGRKFKKCCGAPKGGA